MIMVMYKKKKLMPRVELNNLWITVLQIIEKEIGISKWYTPLPPDINIITQFTWNGN